MVVLQLGGWEWAYSSSPKWEYKRSDGTEVAPNQQENIRFSVETE
jgi:hypothetical protein